MANLIKVRNPRTGQLDYEVNPPGTNELKNICDNLRDAQPGWANSSLSHRLSVLNQLKEKLIAHQEALVSALSTDTGRYKMSAKEVAAITFMIDRWHEKALEIFRPSALKSTAVPDIKFEIQQVPYQLAGMITPWNYPFILCLIDALPALIAGCSVIIKPSEITPRFIAPLTELIQEIPELMKVLRVIPGDGETGQAIINNVDVLCFTGSVTTGKKVAKAAANNFIPAFLELGGKDPAIVLESANINNAVTAILRGALNNSGQTCFSTERVYVSEKIFDEFIEKLATQAATLQLNFPDIRQGQIGPIIFDKQVDIIQSHIADALDKGAEVICGGKIEDHGGLWFQPTVLINVNHQMKVMREETFGPVIPVMPFKDASEAAQLANDTNYGLSASVFCGSNQEGIELAKRINAGAVTINDTELASKVIVEIEKNSFNLSGIGGSRNGAASLARFYRKKSLIVKSGDAAPASDMG